MSPNTKPSDFWCLRARQILRFQHRQPPLASSTVISPDDLARATNIAPDRDYRETESELDFPPDWTNKNSLKGLLSRPEWKAFPVYAPTSTGESSTKDNVPISEPTHQETPSARDLSTGHQQTTTDQNTRRTAAKDQDCHQRIGLGKKHQDIVSTGALPAPLRVGQPTEWPQQSVPHTSTDQSALPPCDPVSSSGHEIPAMASLNIVPEPSAAANSIPIRSFRTNLQPSQLRTTASGYTLRRGASSPRHLETPHVNQRSRYREPSSEYMQSSGARDNLGQNHRTQSTEPHRVPLENDPNLDEPTRRHIAPDELQRTLRWLQREQTKRRRG